MSVCARSNFLKQFATKSALLSCVGNRVTFAHLHHHHIITKHNTNSIPITPKRFCSSSSTSASAQNETTIDGDNETCNVVDQHDPDLPDPTMENPFLKEKRQCILCRYQIEVDYKNIRLLSQFISPFTGRMYDKHITGLCETQHRAVRSQISLATRFGLMSPWYRDTKYGDDPKLFDPTRPSRANPY